MRLDSNVKHVILRKHSARRTTQDAWRFTNLNEPHKIDDTINLFMPLPQSKKGRKNERDN